MENNFNGIPEYIEPTGFLTDSQLEEASAFDDSEPDDSREYEDEEVA